MRLRHPYGLTPPTIRIVRAVRQSSVPWWYFGALSAYGLFNCVDIVAGGQRGDWVAWPIRLAICAVLFVAGLYLAVTGRRARRTGSHPSP